MPEPCSLEHLHADKTLRGFRGGVQPRQAAPVSELLAFVCVTMPAIAFQQPMDATIQQPLTWHRPKYRQRQPNTGP